MKMKVKERRRTGLWRRGEVAKELKEVQLCWL
jgi:hypothetical protein